MARLRLARLRHQCPTTRADERDESDERDNNEVGHLLSLLSIQEIFSIFVASRQIVLADIFLRKCFSLLSKIENVEVFNCKWTERTSLISCIVIGLCTLLVHLPHTIQVWGIVSFILA